MNNLKTWLKSGVVASWGHSVPLAVVPVCSAVAPTVAAMCAVPNSHSGLAPVELLTPVLLFVHPVYVVHPQFAQAAPVTV